MLNAEKPMTHIVWAQHYQGTRFREWIKIGRGRIETDADGNMISHSFTYSIPRGDSGYICMLPIGMKPKDPEAPAPKRPAQSDSGEDF